MDWRHATFPDVINAANSGSLTLDDFLTYRKFGPGGVNDGTANYITLDRANQLLTILKQTEPNDPVTTYIDAGIAGGLMFRNDSKEVIPPHLNNPLNQLGGVTDFLNILTQKNTWVRVAEFLVGIILLGVGANALIKGSSK